MVFRNQLLCVKWSNQNYLPFTKDFSIGTSILIRIRKIWSNKQISNKIISFKHISSNEKERKYLLRQQWILGWYHFHREKSHHDLRQYSWSPTNSRVVNLGFVLERCHDKKTYNIPVQLLFYVFFPKNII